MGILTRYPALVSRCLHCWTMEINHLIKIYHPAHDELIRRCWQQSPEVYSMCKVPLFLEDLEFDKTFELCMTGVTKLSRHVLFLREFHYIKHSENSTNKDMFYTVNIERTYSRLRHTGRKSCSWGKIMVW